MCRFRSIQTCKVEQFSDGLLEREFVKQADYRTLGLALVKDPRVADLVITIDRPLFTYTFTYGITDSKTSVVLDTGKVTAIDGNSAAGKIAKQMIARLKALRQREDTKKPN